ncbi:MAG TPA: hypothetical protein VNK26_00280, partial [Pyrinomonadaceae bacterium]|nr:hypothetical protein [Pyrinomonadaceae bacterium]
MASTTSAKKRIQNPVSNVQSTELLQAREPIHVLYGGADRFTSDSIEKLGKIAIDTVRKYAGNPGDFAEAFGFAAAAQFTKSEFSALSKSYKRSHSELKKNDFDAWLVFRLQERILAKLQSEPVEDFRIDFEDGFGIRSDSEEDSFAVNSAKELAAAIKKRKTPPFFGIRIKPLSDQSFDRAIKTLDLFINTLAGQVKSFPQQFVVTLPK